MTEKSPASSIHSSEPVMTSFDGGDAAPAAAAAVSAVSAVSDVHQSDSVAHTQADDTATDTAASTDANVEDDADAESDEARQPDSSTTVTAGNYSYCCLFTTPAIS